MILLIWRSVEVAAGTAQLCTIETVAKIAYFEIQSDDLDRAQRFFHAVFGWEATRQEGLLIEYLRVTTGGIRGGILPRPAPAPAERSGTNAFVCSVEVADFDAVAATILANGGRVALEKFAVPGTCWQGYFLDPDGNTFGIFQPDTGAR